jgi:hypothetical protein
MDKVEEQVLVIKDETVVLDKAMLEAAAVALASLVKEVKVLVHILVEKAETVYLHLLLEQP